MIKILTCQCSSAEPLVRRALQEAGVADWLGIDVHKGKEHAQLILSRFPEPYHDLLAYRALESYLANASSFAVIVGYDDQSFYWADVHSGAPADWLQGQAILKQFA